jgi:hypothetical protein
MRPYFGHDLGVTPRAAQNSRITAASTVALPVKEANSRRQTSASGASLLVISRPPVSSHDLPPAFAIARRGWADRAVLRSLEDGQVYFIAPIC